MEWGWLVKGNEDSWLVSIEPGIDIVSDFEKHCLGGVLPAIGGLHNVETWRRWDMRDDPVENQSLQYFAHSNTVVLCLSLISYLYF